MSCNLIVGASHLDQTIAKLGVVVKVLAVGDHGAAHDSGGHTLFTNQSVAMCEPLDVGVHGGLKLDHAWAKRGAMLVLGGHTSSSSALGTEGTKGERLTIEAECHLCLEHFELLGGASPGLVTHLFASPLEGAVEFLRELGHVCGVCVAICGYVRHYVLVRMWLGGREDGWARESSELLDACEESTRATSSSDDDHLFRSRVREGCRAGVVMLKQHR